MVDNREEKRISLRVAPELHEKIAAVAASRNLSINAFIIQALESAVDPVATEVRISKLEEFAMRVIELMQQDSPNDAQLDALRNQLFHKASQY